MDKLIRLAKVTLLSIVLLNEMQKLKKHEYLYFKGINGDLRVTNNSKYKGVN